MTKEEFRELTEEIVVLDGATGSNLFKMGMPRGICTEQWVLDHREILIGLQRQYVEAGSHVVLSPTFGASRGWLESYCLEDRIREMNHSLVKLSQEAVEGRAYVAGDLSSLIGKKSSLTDGDLYARALEEYRELISYLVEAGVDLLVLETMTRLDELTAALEAAHEVCSLPVLCSMSVEADGSLYGGGTIFEAVETVQELGADAAGVNCSVGPDQLEAVVAGMKKRISIPVIVKPNAGMPVISDTGEAVYHMTPEAFAGAMKRLVEAGAGIIGGCCGTAPEYIEEMCRICM